VPKRKTATHRSLPTDVAERLASSLRDARQRGALSQEQVAAASQVSVQLVRRLEAGTSNPTLGTLYAVAVALGTTPAQLLAEAEA
jgi:transcriptional regulator with XRE-family HTH domain